VTRRFYRGSVAGPKSKYGRRSVRLAPSLSRTLWPLQGAPNDLVFTSAKGQRVNQANVMVRVLKPAAVRAGLGECVKTPSGKRAESWVGHHTFRHSCATMLFRHGFNAKQVQVWLGHHSPAFTLATYVHLLPSDLPELPMTLDALSAGQPGQHRGNATGRPNPCGGGSCRRAGNPRGGSGCLTICRSYEFPALTAELRAPAWRA